MKRGHGGERGYGQAPGKLSARAKALIGTGPDVGNAAVASVMDLAGSKPGDRGDGIDMADNAAYIKRTIPGRDGTMADHAPPSIRDEFISQWDWALSAPPTQEVNSVSGIIECINLVTRGSGDGERVGAALRGLSVQLRGTLTHTKITAAGLTSVAVALVWDYSPANALPVISDIYGESGSGLWYADAPQNPDYRHRFKEVFRQTYLMPEDPAATATVSGATQVIEAYAKLPPDAFTKWEAVSVAVPTITTTTMGALYLICLSNGGVGSSPDITIGSRFTYEDLEPHIREKRDMSASKYGGFLTHKHIPEALYTVPMKKRSVGPFF